MALEMAYVIKKFYPYFWHKFKFPVEDDAEIECEEFVKNLREAVWVHRIVSLWHWRLFLKKNLSPMISSPETYVSYIFFMISSTIKDLPNIHESFMTSCSLVTAVAAYVYVSGYHEFLEFCPDILMVLFEENYSKESDRVQIRDHFITCHYSDVYKIVEKKTNGNPFADVVNQLDFVTEIKEIIKSKVSVSEDAAVHRHTMELIERFRTRTSRNHSFIESRAIILKRNASSQTEGSLQNTEEQRKSESGQRISKEHIELIGLEISQSLPDIVKRLLDVVESVSRLDDTEVIRMKRGFPSQPEKPLQDVESPRISEAEQSSTRTEGINLNHISSYETEQRLEELKMLGKGQTTSVGDTEAINLKISPVRSEQSLQEKEKQSIYENEETARLEKNKIINLERITSQPERPQTRDEEDAEDVDLTNSSSYSEEQSIQNVEKSRISNSEESTSMVEETEAMISKRNLPFQMEQSFEEDLEKPRIPERKQSLSVTKDINLKQISSFQTEVQSLQNDMNKLRILDNEQNTPVKSPFNNFNSDDGISRFEAENPTEENYVDKLHDTEAANQNTAPQSKQKSKKKKRKSKKTKTSRKKISVKVEYSEAVDSKISSYSEEQSLQNIEKPRDTEVSLPVPSKQEVLYALLFLMQKLTNSFRNVSDLLDLPMNN